MSWYGVRANVRQSIIYKLNNQHLPVSPYLLQNLTTNYLRFGFVFRTSVKLVKLWLKYELRKFTEI